MGCIDTAFSKAGADIEMLRADDLGPEDHTCLFEHFTVPHSNKLLFLQSSLSLCPDVSLAFRSNGRDCFFNGHEMHEVESDRDVPLQENQATIQIVHHHFHHFLPEKPKLVAPPLHVVPVNNRADLAEDKKLITPSVQVFPENKLNGSMKTKDSFEQSCAHCCTITTSLWRRVEDRLMCNACALYLKLHGSDRPLHLSTGVIKRRNRVGGSLSRRPRKQ